MAFLGDLFNKNSANKTAKSSGASTKSPKKAIVADEVLSPDAQTAKVTPSPVTLPNGPFRAGEIILKPHVTEKTSRGAQTSTYTFIVAHRATKGDVRRALKQMYGVNTVGVNIVNEADSHRKTRFGSTRVRGRKKAMVTVAKGQSIDLAKSPRS